MDHNRCMFVIVFINIGQIESCRQAEVQLAGGEGILGTDSRFYIHVKLRAIKRSLADFLRIFDAEIIEHLPEGCFRCVPHFIVIMILHLVCRITQREYHAVIGNAEIFIGLKNQVNYIGDLVPDLLRCYKEVRVILAEVATSFDPFQRSGCLIPEIMGNFTDTYREIPVGMRLVGINAHMVRAVHRTKDIGFLINLHSRKHILLIMIPVSGSFIKIHRSDTRRQHMLIAGFDFLITDIVFQNPPDRISLGKEHRHSAAYKVIRHKQVQLTAYLAVIPSLCFLKLFQISIQLFLLREGNAVDTLQRFSAGISAPVSSIAGQQFKGVVLYPSRPVEVRTGAQIGEFTLPVKTDRDILRQIINQLNLKRLLSLFHELQSFVSGQFKTFNRQIFLADFLHLRFDLLHVFRCNGKRHQQVVIPSFFDGRTDCQLSFRPEPFDCLRHNMRAGMPICLSIFLIFKGILVIQFFHDNPPKKTVEILSFRQDNVNIVLLWKSVHIALRRKHGVTEQ